MRPATEGLAALWSRRSALQTAWAPFELEMSLRWLLTMGLPSLLHGTGTIRHRLAMLPGLAALAAVAVLAGCGALPEPASSGAAEGSGTSHQAKVGASANGLPHQLPEASAIASEVARAMADVDAQGLAVALIDDGRVAYLQAFGRRNQAGDPLQTDTVMSAASLTKPLFAVTVLQLAAEGRIDLDTSIARYLPQPLPSYGPQYGPARGLPDWRDLAGDERWRQLTPRILLSHRSGFANFTSLEPDGKLHIHFEPGSRYAYSGDGLLLLQFVLERGLGLDVGAEMQRRILARFEMRHSGLTWRIELATNQADGFTSRGSPRPHDRFMRVRASGSMDTTIEDFARFAAGFMRGEALSAASRSEMLAPQQPITTARQFPTLLPELPVPRRRSDLAAGLGVVLFQGPQGPGFFKGGHGDGTGNTWVCIEAGRRCMVLLSNDVRAEAVFPRLVRFMLGETGVPWDWEYGR